ncbi:hypothetical protein EX895_005715 [Sporisorium graminicola]|uniref:Uncharacterized protein n=1 Tax=Sporisorium graminicola TaxID=280036 RepID=A0A4U7KN48_9BASI|nr:hypothetical protein EX895_005715 [Sporisorium graminicola]TKY85553.1 hypothetical protein EX895_005715 [Sporisorium graminicola]
MSVALSPVAHGSGQGGIASMMHGNGNGTDSSGFPLAADATVGEMLTLVDALALKMYPKGFWQLTWSMNAVNLASFLLVTVALRAYRSRKNPVPFWLVRLEQRPYRIKRKVVPCVGSSPAHGVDIGSNALPTHSSDVSPRSTHWIVQKWERLLGRRRSTISINGEKGVASGPTHTIETTDEEMRMGWFITASCVNCHLLFTSTYVLVLAVRTLQSHTTRLGTSPPALLDPGGLDCIMIAAIFSTAYFAAIGYMALLLPNVPPWLWNSSVVLIYTQVIVVGGMSTLMIASSGSKITSHRSFLHLARAVLPSFGVEFGEQGELEQVAGAVLMGIARLAWAESMRMKMWQQLAQGLVALGGFALALVYLAILVLLARRVAKELVELRSSSGRTRFEAKQQKLASAGSAVLTWPPVAAQFSLGPTAAAAAAAAQSPTVLKSSAILCAARMDLPLRMSYLAARTPPMTPAPSGPLPLPPVEGASSNTGDSRISPPTPIATSMSPGTRLPLPLSTTDASAVACARAFRARDPHLGSCVRLSSGSDKEEAFQTTHDGYSSLDSPTDTVAGSRLDLGPRIRVDSDAAANPWDLATLHEDLATNDGYTAVCRFLFNCIIDHVAVMLQCFFFGCRSVYLLLVFTKDYPNNAAQASSMVNVALMVASSLFSVLYVLNCLNLFAPFLLFPASQVKLASMLASLTLPDSGLEDHGRSSSGSSNRGRSSCRGERRTSPLGQPLGNRSAEEQALKHHDSRASLVASASKLTSEEYTSGNSSGRGAWGASVDASIHSHSSFNRKGDRDVDSFAASGVGYPPMSASLPNCPSPAVGAGRRDRSTASGSGADVGKIAAHVVAAAVKRLRPSTATTANAASAEGNTAATTTFTDGSRSHDQYVPYGALISAARVTRAPPSSLVHESKSSALTMPPFRSKRHHTKPNSAAAGWRRQEASESGSARSSSVSQRPPTGTQLVLDSLISSHALPIQGFYCQRSAIDSSAGLRLYQQQQQQHSSDLGESGGTPMNVFEEYAQARERDRSSQRSLPPYQQRRGAEEAEEHLELSHADDADAGMGEASKRRRHRLRMQFRCQVEQSRLSAGYHGGMPREQARNGEGEVSVPTIVAHPPTPLGRELAQQEEKGRNETKISLPLQYRAASVEGGSEGDEVGQDGDREGGEDEDAASVVSDTFG